MRSCFNCKAKLEENFKFCPSCGVEGPLSPRCPKCGNTKIQNAAFCTECGTQLGTANETVTILEADIGKVPNTGFTIEFGYSTSQNYEAAVREAMKHPSYQTFGSKRSVVHRISFIEDEISSLAGFTEIISGWKSSKLYYDGEQTDFHQVFGFSYCYKSRQRSYKPELYCFGHDNKEIEFNLWGCIQARMSFTMYADWFAFGRWINKRGDWQFDKERIQHELETRLYSVRFCPALQPALIKEVLSIIPETVNPNNSKEWEYVREYGDSNVSDGLAVVIKHDWGYQEKVLMRGVRPTKSGIRKLIQKIKASKLPNNIL